MLEKGRLFRKKLKTSDLLSHNEMSYFCMGTENCQLFLK